MPLPPRLQRYGRLIDYLVELLVREDAAEGETDAPGARLVAAAEPEPQRTLDKSGRTRSSPAPRSAPPSKRGRPRR